MFSRDEALALDQLPGALLSETVLSQAWVREFGAPYLGFDFNVPLGEGRDPGAHIPEKLRQASIEASKPRADVVAYGDGFVDLLEVKGRADSAALGQLVSYTVLWNKMYPDRLVRNTGVIAAFLNATLLEVYNSANVPVFLYPDLLHTVRRT